VNPRWKFEDDVYLVSFFEAVGDRNVCRDLKRKTGAAERRAKRLKETGAWQAVDDWIKADFTARADHLNALGSYRDLYFLCLTHIGAPDGWERIFPMAAALEACEETSKPKHVEEHR
jgi:hypothetical protein